MIEDPAMHDPLSEAPVIEFSPWIVGEPELQDLLGDPVIHAVLRRDGLSLQDLRRAIALGRARLSPTTDAPATDHAPASDAA